MPYISDEDIKDIVVMRESTATPKDSFGEDEELPYSPKEELQSILDATFLFADVLRNEDGKIPELIDEWRLTSVLDRLIVYGSDGRYYDAYGEGLPIEDEQLKKDIDDLGTLLGWVPKNWFIHNDGMFSGPGRPILSFGALEVVFGTARARYRLDTHKSLTVLDVSLLANMTLKSVLNATQKRLGDKRLVIIESEPGELKATKKSSDTKAWFQLVSYRNALHWLKGRRSFQPSDIPDSTADQSEPTTSDPYIEEFVMVPISDKGEAFLPDQANLNSFFDEEVLYEIREGNKVKNFTEYYSALETLNTLRNPRWHISSNSGQKIIVEGTKWVRREKSTIQPVVHNKLFNEKTPLKKVSLPNLEK